MSYITTPVYVLLLLLVSVGAAPADESAPERDLLSTALKDARLTVLVAALNQADLVEELRGRGPFTVFAPTDKAFAALPAGVVSTLLRPEQKGELKQLLGSHVVRGRLHAASLLPRAAVEASSGAQLTLGLRVGTANVIQSDIRCANGVIHVIDAVLMPSKRTSTPTHAETLNVASVLRKAIETGVPLFNAGDEKGCARVYLSAAKRLLAAPRSTLSDLAASNMADVVANLPTDATKQAWALRRAFDQVLSDAEFKPTVEAALPVGFPNPGPVGKVVQKTYPKYRAARAMGGGQGGSFWTLFQHIKKNNVEMTAPVEMTLDADMRMQDMAFLYEAPTQGAAGKQGQVRVLDLDRVRVLSIGMRGRRTSAGLKTAKLLIERRLKELGLRAAGSWRVLGYNSPMVAGSKQFWELQIPTAAQ